MNGTWFIRQHGKVYGPCDLAKLTRLARDGKITPQTEVGQSQRGPWSVAAEIRGLFPPPLPTKVGPTRPAPPPPPADVEDDLLPEEYDANHHRGGYVTANLLPGEQVVYWAKLHWFIFVTPVVILLLALFVLIVTASNAKGDAQVPGFMISGTLGFLGLWMLLSRYTKYVSSEFAVTTKRVILKTGFIQRRSLELLHNKIDALSVDQSICGRIFNYGAVGVGVATEKQFFNFIRDPLELRRQVQARQTL